MQTLRSRKKSVVDVEACGICGSSARHKYLHLFFPETGEFNLVRCNNCSFIYNSPRLADDCISGLYGPEYYLFQQDAQTSALRALELYKRSVAVLSDVGVPGKSVLDIGSAQGFHLALLKELGWHPVGLEISPEAAAFAAETWNVPVHCGRIEDFSAESSGQFHLVLASDVIEHVTDPKLFVRFAAKVLSHGGYLVIDTPNGNSHNLEVQGQIWSGLNPFHIHFLTEQHLNTLAAASGLEVVRSFTYGNKEQTTDQRLREIHRGQWKRQILGKFLYSAARRLKYKYRNQNLHHLISTVANLARSGASYLHESDATLPLAKTKRGDNLVCVLRKSR